MGDAYWRHGGQPAAIPPISGKRPRSDFDIPGGREFPSYIARDDERAAHLAVRDTNSIQASYDQYLRSAISAYGGGEPTRHLNVGVSSHPTHPIEDPRLFGYGLDPPVLAKGRPLGMGVGRPEISPMRMRMGVGRPEISPLPHDASDTLFVEGLPPSCTRREVSHIFRPFVGYKEVRLVSKEAKHQGDPLVLCFVDFVSPAHAATAMDALQGYKFDEHDRDSAYLRMQFARNPGLRTGSGTRTGGGRRGKR